MGIKAEAGAGAIYRYYRGELRQLYSQITISNAICFAPDGKTAYFTDTPTQQIMRVALDADGWPVGDPVLHIDLPARRFPPRWRRRRCRGQPVECAMGRGPRRRL